MMSFLTLRRSRRPGPSTSSKVARKVIVSLNLHGHSWDSRQLQRVTSGSRSFRCRGPRLAHAQRRSSTSSLSLMRSMCICTCITCISCADHTCNAVLGVRAGRTAREVPGEVGELGLLGGGAQRGLQEGPLLREQPRGGQASEGEREVEAEAAL